MQCMGEEKRNEFKFLAGKLKERSNWIN